MTTSAAARTRVRGKVLRAEAWGGVVLDERHDRVWAFGRDEFAELGRALAGGSEPVSEPTREFVARFDRADDPGPNPYLRQTGFFLGPPPAVEEFDLSAPISVSWSVTNRCQCECVFCCTDSHPRAHPGLDADGAVRVVELVRGWEALRLIIGGGEPLLYPGFPRVLARCRELGVRPTVATNGFLLDRADTDLLRDSVMAVQVSLDSLRGPVYDLLRGCSSGVPKVTRGLERVTRAGLFVRAVTVLTRKNQAELPELAAYLAGAGVRQWFVFLVQPSGRGRDRIGELAPTDLDQAVEALAEAGAAHPELSVSFWGADRADQLAVYVDSEGALAIHDYGTGASNRIAALPEATPEDLRRAWAAVDTRTKWASLMNFTSAGRNPAARLRG